MTSSYFLFSSRFKICLLLAGVLFLMQFMNIALGMTIICMCITDLSHQTAHPGYNESNLDSDSMSHLHHMNISEGDVLWTPSVQGIVLSSLSWGRLLTPLGGFICDKYNVKILAAASVIVASIATVIPSVASVSYVLVIVCRVAIGMADAVVQPSVNRFISIWFPSDERSTAISIATSGRQVGVFVVFPLAGALCERRDLLGGWPLVYYISSVLAVLWLGIWIVYSNQNLTKHKWLRESERSVILKDITSQTPKVGKGSLKIPWKDLLTSIPMWANIFAILCHEFPLAMIFIFLPNYMRDVLHFQANDIGILATIPVLVFLVFKIASSQIADRMIRQSRFSATTIAKLFNSVGAIGLGVFLIGVGRFNCHSRLTAFSLLTAAIGSAALQTPGGLSTTVRIAPSYSGMVSGLTFCVVGLATLVNPLLVKAIVVEGSRREWNIVFTIAGTISLLPLVIFNIFGSAKVQPWSQVINTMEIPKFEKSRSESTNGIENHGYFETIKL